MSGDTFCTCSHCQMRFVSAANVGLGFLIMLKILLPVLHFQVDQRSGIIVHPFVFDMFR